MKEEDITKKTRKQFKLSLSICLTLALLVSPVELALAATNGSIGLETVDISSMYRKYDLETGEVSLVPKAAPSVYRNGKQVTSTQPYIPVQNKIVQHGERSIIGNDDRVPITETTNYPYYAVARLEVEYTDGTYGNATGFMVSSNVMLTAGHVCMSHASNAPVRSMRVSLGQNGSLTPTVAYASSYYVCANFTYFNDDDQDDYAIVVLNSNVGNTTGWFGLDYQADIFFHNYTFVITGYPLDKPTGTMWSESGSIEECSTYLLHYKMDVVAGQSGSPIYALNNVAYGINVSGTSSLNNGRRMTKEVFDWLVTNGFIS